MGRASTLPGIRAALLLVCGTTACVRQLPAAPTPPVATPQLESMPPPPLGIGRVVIDVVDSHVTVRRVMLTATQFGASTEPAPIPPPPEQPPFVASSSTLGNMPPPATPAPPPIVHPPRYRFSQSDTVLCEQTPCVAQLPIGNVLVGFPVIGQPETMETELIHVAESPSVYRRQLSLYEDHTGAMRTLGIIGVPIGAAGLSVGGVLLSVGLSKHEQGMTTAGAITLGSCTALLVMSILAIQHDAPTFRPGSANHYPLDVPPPVQPPGIAP
ncbi:MAG TPA: hypothetical protein VGM90_29220 [Kofleriaceae bacterium]